MKKLDASEKKESKFKKVMKYVGVGLGASVFTALGCWYVFSDKTDNIPNEDRDEDKKSDEYMRGYNSNTLNTLNYCKENGKSIIATYSSKGPGPENVEYWLVAELTDQKPDLPDILVDATIF